VTSVPVSAEHLSKWYGQVIGLNDVSVTVPAGITGLLGPNGAGKSTFMKLVTGQLKPSKGGITVLGEPIWQNPALYTRIGFCPEQDAFYDRMTGLEWVTALVRLNGMSESEAVQMAHRSLEMVELIDAANKKIGAYSKGMRQRVKMAQAIAHDHSRRAAVRHGSDRTPQNHPHDQGLGPRRQERDRLEPYPSRNRVDDGEHPPDQPGPDPG
jgi:ABC-2 type transport system ATP-binding protein